MRRRSLFRELSARPNLRPLRLAILGGSTTSSLVEVLEILLLASGFAPVFYESGYGRFYEEAVFEPCNLVESRPDVIYIHTSYLNVPKPQIGISEDEASLHLSKQIARFKSLWDAIDANIGSQIIQNNFELPPYALLGNLDATSAGAQSRMLMRLNEHFAVEANKRPSLLILDINSLSAHIGLSAWFDWNRYFTYKVLLSPAANYAVCRSIVSVVQSIYGKMRKVLILDLDNTLWGGVIGDDGVDRIQIGRETPVAEAYTAFQEYCLALRDRGILLAVCSKNTDETARSGFAHPSSVLKLEHFSCFKANWLPKYENIVEIGLELNLGLDSFVFIDDNPAERAIVAAQIPDVAVPDVGDEVSQFPSIIDAARYFEPISLSRVDVDRAALYQSDLERHGEQAKFADYGEYLDSLQMTAEIDCFRQSYLERIAQLTNKTNQYNLTGRRYTPAEIESAYKSPAQIGLCGRLSDRFGDNGLISIVLGTQTGETLEIELWLMSCRVFKRCMEEAMLDELVRHAVKRGIRRIQGVYLPTLKNAMVADHYSLLGFTRTSESDVEGATFWTLDLEMYTDRNTHISISMNSKLH